MPTHHTPRIQTETGLVFVVKTTGTYTLRYYTLPGNQGNKLMKQRVNYKPASVTHSAIARL